MATVDNKHVQTGIGQVGAHRAEEIRPESGHRAEPERRALRAPDSVHVPIGEQLPAGTTAGENAQVQLRAEGAPQRRLGKRQKNLRTENLARLSPQERRAFGSVKNVLDQGADVVRRQSNGS